MSSNNNDNNNNKGWLEGLGGPIHMDRVNNYGIDPTLDSCCIREEINNRKGTILRRTLDRFDISTIRERYQRNLIQTANLCRCCYDPNNDGGEYNALIQYKQEKQQQQEQQLLQEQHDDDEDNLRKGEKENDEPLYEEEQEHKKINDNTQLQDDNNNDSDDEYDYLLDDEDIEQNVELKMLEDTRRIEIEMELLQRDIIKQHGYGVYQQMHPTRVLKASGLLLGNNKDVTPHAVVLHLYDPESRICASLDYYIETQLCTNYLGTKFLRANGRTTLLMDVNNADKVLPKLHPDRDIPTLITIKDGVIMNICPNLQGLIDEYTNSIIPHAVIEYLERSNVLIEQIPKNINIDMVCRILPEEDALIHSMIQLKQQQQEERYDCGNPLCNKSFPHEHIGENYNEEQNGLIITEEQIVNDNNTSPFLDQF